LGRIGSPAGLMLVVGGFCYGRLLDDGGSFMSRRIHRRLRVTPTGSSAS
jgi:hypothetical protein